MTIAELPEGSRFRLAALPHRTGDLLRLGTGSAVVRYHGAQHKHVVVARGDEIVADREFDAPLKPVTISLATEVERITQGG